MIPAALVTEHIDDAEQMFYFRFSEEEVGSSNTMILES